MYNIQSMFHSATIRLTVWYLAGIMTLSIMFSLLIYSLSMNELTAKIGALHARLEASNIAIPWTLASYATARKTTLPAPA